MLGIEHGKALHHVVERGIELKVLQPQFLFLRLEQLVLLLEPLDGAFGVP